MTYPSLTRDTNLIQPLLSTNHQRPLHTQQLQHLCKRIAQLLSRHAQQHALGRRWIYQRPKDVEDGAEVELSPDGRNVRQGRMIVRGKQEQEWRVRQKGGERGDGECESAVEREEEVGGA
jgi:hypothetical protein